MRTAIHVDYKLNKLFNVCFVAACVVVLSMIINIIN